MISISEINNAKFSSMRPSCSLQVRLLDAQIDLRYLGYLPNRFIISPAKKDWFIKQLSRFYNPEKDEVFGMKIVCDNDVPEDIGYMLRVNENEELAGILLRCVRRFMLEVK
jgi:hypothetical protein